MSRANLPRRAWVEVDRGALCRNFARLQRRVAPARILAVVKADAYGHGAVEVARTLEPLGVAGFGVATLDEGVDLRLAGIAASILVLSPVPDDGFDLLVSHRLTPVISSLPALRALRDRAAALGVTVPLHLKFDTGMTRLGLEPDQIGMALAQFDGGSPLRLEGVLSHLAEAERPDAGAALAQLRSFEGLLDPLRSSPLPRPTLHLANSAAAIHLPATRFDQVRIGIALHGYDPSGGDRAGLGLEPTMSVRAEIVQVKDVPAGRRVGYGGRFVAPRASSIAIVPVGYADGYSWRLGARAEAIVRGRRVPVAGSVSMDLMALDLTGSGADAGELVTLLGAQGDERIDAFELAEHVGSIPYQLLCLFGLRLARRYSDAPVGDLVAGDGAS